MNPRTGPGLIAALILAATPSAPSAADLVRSVLGAGGVSASGGTLTLRGTVGQTALGGAVGPSHALKAGYWSTGDPGAVAVDPPPLPGAGLPRELSFGPASPSPARGLTRFRLALPEDAQVALLVYDVSGRAQGSEHGWSLPAGYHDLWWRNPDAPPGVYFVRLAVNGAIREQRRFVQLGR